MSVVGACVVDEGNLLLLLILTKVNQVKIAVGALLSHKCWSLKSASGYSHHSRLSAAATDNRGKAARSRGGSIRRPIQRHRAGAAGRANARRRLLDHNH